MPSATLESAGTTIVILGSFNPGIIQPAWLARYELITDGEAEDAQVEIVRDEFARIVLGWVTIQVFRDRFEIAATPATPSIGPVRDLALGIMELLPHMPIARIGLNSWAHYRMPSEDAWHALGHRLIPPEDWTPVLERPGMLSADVRGVRTDDHTGTINVSVQPSNVVRPNGVFITTNDDFDLREEGESKSAADALDLLRTVWDESQARAKKIREHILSLTEHA